MCKVTTIFQMVFWHPDIGSVQIPAIKTRDVKTGFKEIRNYKINTEFI